MVPALLVLAASIKALAQTGQFYLLGRTSQRILLRLRRDVFAALLRQPPAFYSRQAHGDLLSRLTHDAGVVEQALFYGCGPLLRDSLGVLILLGFCVASDARLAALTCLAVPVAVLPLRRFTRWLKRVSRGGQAAAGSINAVCYEALAGIRVVQAFGAEPRELARLEAAGEHYFQSMRASYFIRAVRTPTMETLGTAALALLLAYLGQQVQGHGADAAHYVSFFAAIVLMYDPLKKLGSVSDYLAAGAAAAERLHELMDRPPSVRDRPQARPLRGLQRGIAFEEVSFTYGHTPVLTDCSLQLPAGQMLALVGTSGAGKSTLAHLLPRFYDVTGGAITLDGVDLRDLTLASLRQHINIVGQDTFLFNASVAHNIAYGCPGASFAAIEAAAHAAQAGAFIEALPQGYGTVLGERGVTLSGGQRQRLAIARALLRDAPLLVLDEATSSLDLDSERKVQAALAPLLQGRTALVIAHRLSTVRDAHQIAVLQGGRIVECGSHAALLQQEGAYARLHRLQFAAATGQPAGSSQAAS